MTDDTSSTEAMPQMVEMYRHYADEESCARDGELLGSLGWRVESLHSLPARRGFQNLFGMKQCKGHSPVDAHYLRPTWPDSWQ